MQASIETLGTLERRLKVAVPLDQINAEVDNRLKRLQRTVKLAGFRPGKVPIKVVERQFGPQVRQEVLGDMVERTFGEAVREKNLRVAGLPRIEAKPAAEAQEQFEFTATFEVFPEIELGDLAAHSIARPMVTVGEADVDRTVEVLRRQRTSYEAVDRAALKGDLVVIDYQGRIDGVPFEGGEAKGQAVTLGEGRLLPEFEAALEGVSAGEARTFELTFPADYHGQDVAGKKAEFTVTLHKVQEAKIPAVDAEFARALGIADGDLDRMRADVKGNLEREVKRRVRQNTKDQALKVLLDASKFDVPKALIEAETDRLAAGMMENLRGRGMNAENVNIPRDAFEPEARRRVSIGLVLNELVRREGIKAEPEQIRTLIDEYAQSYEEPEEVVRWYYQSPERVREVEAVVLENNVVDWVLGRVSLTDRDTPFDELMGGAS
jgi:trigger factor